MQADAFCFDGDAALALEVHGIEDLFVHFALGQGASHFEQAVGERGFAVVDVRDDAEISNELGVHFSRLPIFSIAGRIRMARPSFRRACCIRTSDTRSAKTVPDKQPVCHNSKAASACPPNANETKNWHDECEKSGPPRKAGPTGNWGSASAQWPNGLQAESSKRRIANHTGCALQEFSSNDGAQSWLDKEGTRCIYIYYARRGA